MELTGPWFVCLLAFIAVCSDISADQQISPDGPAAFYRESDDAIAIRQNDATSKIDYEDSQPLLKYRSSMTMPGPECFECGGGSYSGASGSSIAGAYGVERALGGAATNSMAGAYGGGGALGGGRPFVGEASNSLAAAFRPRSLGGDGAYRAANANSYVAAYLDGGGYLDGAPYLRVKPGRFGAGSGAKANSKSAAYSKSVPRTASAYRNGRAQSKAMKSSHAAAYEGSLYPAGIEAYGNSARIQGVPYDGKGIIGVGGYIGERGNNEGNKYFAGGAFRPRSLDFDSTALEGTGVFDGGIGEPAAIGGQFTEMKSIGED